MLLLENLISLYFNKIIIKFLNISLRVVLIWFISMCSISVNILFQNYIKISREDKDSTPVYNTLYESIKLRLNY